MDTLLNISLSASWYPVDTPAGCPASVIPAMNEAPKNKQPTFFRRLARKR